MNDKMKYLKRSQVEISLDTQSAKVSNGVFLPVRGCIVKEESPKTNAYPTKDDFREEITLL